jgi:regulator of sigma E protease
LFVLAAGAGANFIAAIIIFWIALVLGPPAIAIGEVHEGSPALAAGLLADDVILKANGVRTESTGDLLQVVQENAGTPIELLILRDGGEQIINLVTRHAGEYDTATDGPIGVSLKAATNGVRMSRAPAEAAVDSLAFMWENISLYGRLPGMLIRGEITPQEARPVSVIGISQIAGMAAENSAMSRNLYPILTMAAFINIALGLTNLLPIPALDGGRIMFVLVEAIRGRRVEPERESMVHIIGMLVLLGLMALMIFQDIVNPIVLPQ